MRGAGATMVAAVAGELRQRGGARRRGAAVAAAAWYGAGEGRWRRRRLGFLGAPGRAYKGAGEATWGRGRPREAESSPDLGDGGVGSRVT